MTQTKTKTEDKPLTFVIPDPEDPQRRTTLVTVKPLDTDQVPDAPESERTEVLLTSYSFGQVLNARYRAAKARVGKEIRPEWAERALGDRFFTDSLDLPRLLELGVVRLPAEIEADAELDARAAELEGRAPGSGARASRAHREGAAGGSGQGDRARQGAPREGGPRGRQEREDVDVGASRLQARPAIGR